jgi:hypothetical protein
VASSIAQEGKTHIRLMRRLPSIDGSHLSIGKLDHISRTIESRDRFTGDIRSQIDDICLSIVSRKLNYLS